MKVLVFGSTGQVGVELLQAAWPAGTTVIGTARPAVDLTQPKTLDAVFARVAPDLVINAGAYTAVDKAENDPEGAFAVNRDGPASLAALAAARDIPLLHISTDYVFDGSKPTPYLEDDAIAPLGVYGASKAAGEDAVRRVSPRHVILRTAWVYAAHGNNFVKTMLRLGREREELSVVRDQHGAPTAAADIAAALVVIASRVAAGGGDAPWGTYHFTAAGVTTWHGFAEHIFQHLEKMTGRRPRLRPITTAEYPSPTRRPMNSVLDCSRVRDAFGIEQPAWEDSLTRVLAELSSKPEHP